MSIRIRLLLSYIAMLVIPVILSIIAGFIILGIHVGQIHDQGLLRHGFLKTLTQNASKIFLEVQQTAASNPDKLKDMAYLDKLDKRLNIINTGIAVKKNHKLIYISKAYNEQNIIAKLNENDINMVIRNHPVTVGDRTLNFFKREFFFRDKTLGTLYFITDISPIGQFAKGVLADLGKTVMIIIILTNGLLTFLVSRSIIKPLRVLKAGTEQIKNGNLDFAVKCVSKDEIGDVCVAFENMRVKLKESIEMQMQYEENRKELISNISHDLKTPITSIKGYVEGILDGVANSPEKLEKYTRTIYTKATDMDRLIDDLFLFSKLDLKKLPFDFEMVDIHKYFEDCIEELRMDLETQKINLSFFSDCSNVIVIADREKLKRVINNIVANAVKYMDKEYGKIIIALKEQEDEVIVKIEDNGQGINSEDIPFVFDRFYRADSSRNTANGGTGLGLAIVKQIIEGHKGHIWAESKQGKGTNMFFTLKKYKSVENEKVI